MDSYYIVDTIATANYSANTYYSIYVDTTASLTYKGVAFPSPTGGPIVIDLTVNGPTDVAGSTGIILMGKKKPQAFAPGPPGQGGVNTDGTWNIKG
tara:strand:+ start:7704 stop:7991 length:288 start_codon:yes stop_codon:yes gene_type:complete